MIDFKKNNFFYFKVTIFFTTIIWVLSIVKFITDNNLGLGLGLLDKVQKSIVSFREEREEADSNTSQFNTSLDIDIAKAIAEERSKKQLKLPKRYLYEETLVEPPSIAEIEANLTYYLHTLHDSLGALAGPKADPQQIWETYLEVTTNTLIKWDDQNKHHFPKPRKDNSIFVSLGSYRDPFCPMTIKSLFSQAARPERLFVGLFQQNCFDTGNTCRTGVLTGGVVEYAGPDPDCYELFCASKEGIASNACKTGQVRNFNVNESESLGPYMARYLGAKFYRGEQYYLQIDSHSEFVKNWDFKLIQMMEAAPAKKPVLSTYPPDSTMDWVDSIGYRMCDSEFAAAQIEWQIIRLSPSRPFGTHPPAVPTYAPFVAAGFFFTIADFLHEVPFDPLLPWIFMGEEISMSSRLWTAGYDIFNPTTNVLNHYYVRRHYPKFWESVNRFFKKPVHNQLIEVILRRCKNMLGYPEATAELISPNSVLYRLEDWGMGSKRSFASYMQMVGIDTVSKKVTPNRWCHEGVWPEIAQPYYTSKG